VEAAILATMERLAQEGFEDDRVDAVVHQIELSSRRVSSQSQPLNGNISAPQGKYISPSMGIYPTTAPLPHTVACITSHSHAHCHKLPLRG
jgi:hypothetical protein